MDALTELLALAKAGHFAQGNRPIIATSPHAANDGPISPVDVANTPALTQPLPPALEHAVAALTAEERALVTPDVCAALLAELPREAWADFTDAARRDWVRERLGRFVRFWNVTVNGRRWRVAPRWSLTSCCQGRGRA